MTKHLSTAPPDHQRCVFVYPDGRECKAWRMVTSGLGFCISHSKQSEENPKTNIIYELEKGLLSGCLQGEPEDFKPWMSLLKGIYGLSALMDEEDVKLWTEFTHREKPGKGRRYPEVYIVGSRRIMKSLFSAVQLAYHACCEDWSHSIKSGETAQALCLAVSKEQGQIVFNYVLEIMNSNPKLKAMIKKERASSLVLKNGIEIVVAHSSYRTLRGKAVIFCSFDELAFLHYEGSNPAEEIIQALKPSMMTIKNSQLVAVSTPYGKSGILYQKFQESFSKDHSKTLVVKADYRLNPKLDVEKIKQELRENPTSKSEWLAEFREDISAFIPEHVLQACVEEGRVTSRYDKRENYTAFVDPSSGAGIGNDDFSCAIAHLDRRTGRVIVDLVHSISAPFKPSRAIAQISKLLKQWKIHTVTGDKYSKNYVEEHFLEHGIRYKYATMTTSELYLEVQGLMISGEVVLPDNPKLLEQFLCLEEVTRSGGRSKVDAPSWGGMDDESNACSGAIVEVKMNPPFDINDERNLPQKIPFKGDTVGRTQQIGPGTKVQPEDHVFVDDKGHKFKFAGTLTSKRSKKNGVY